MRPVSALQWKRFYDEERSRTRLDALLDAAPVVELPPRGALIFPHTMLAHSGLQPASVASAVLRARPDRLLILGVLHGARERDAERVAAARSGDAHHRAALRGLHGPGVDGDARLWSEEFSTDNIIALLRAAYARAGATLPELLVRYPFLVGDSPHDLPGMDALRAIVDGGAAVIATGDLQHHGAGYGTPLAEQRPVSEVEFARSVVTRELGLLCARDFQAHQRHCASVRSDFRDVGPVLLSVVTAARFTLHALQTVDYAAVIESPDPTWVTAALASVGP